MEERVRGCESGVQFWFGRSWVGLGTGILGYNRD